MEQRTSASSVFLTRSGFGIRRGVTLGHDENMRKWTIAWATMSVLALAGCIFSFMNLWAAADLGYDTSERGKMILQNWS